MEDIHQRINHVNAEMSRYQNQLYGMKKRIPVLILIGTVFAFLFPYLPGRYGRPAMVDTWGYSNAVIFNAVIFAIVYLIGYSMRKNEIEKKLRELKLEKYLIEKDLGE